jgi:methylated-DNA-[protein]-cysteine S-methyltransferase
MEFVEEESNMLNSTYYTYLPSPIDDLLLMASSRGLSGLHMQGGRHVPRVAPEWVRAEEPFAAIKPQLRAYFQGEPIAFSVELDLEGTEFQKSVWRALLEIEYGKTTSYAAIASRIGRPRAVRAVGLANGRNPVSIIVPCHRVIGSNGSLTGYGGGIERKQFLLSMEAPSGHLL